jgi:hypothetical protein
MSRMEIVILMYHRYKPIDLIYIIDRIYFLHKEPLSRQ